MKYTCPLCEREKPFSPVLHQGHKVQLNGRANVICNECWDGFKILTETSYYKQLTRGNYERF